ncbi:amino acid permease/ SLC12A domain-containing protein [Aspergillus pseudoustus]|uniref:Amino acid permease/ SLC12A domain-containing protein n=1 Tax=Aspergillus pseudoustus TaxID=1810923 RepID=A0ABR4KAZ1_9EURO
MSDEEKSRLPSTERKAELEPTISVNVGETDNLGSLHRSFTPRQVHVISLGCNIGSGLFIGTGKALANGGPGNIILAYFAVCIGVWAHLQTLAEMTIAFPTSGNYIDYADRWVDPALAFGAGLAEWLGWTAVFASEGTFFVVLVDYWADGSVPEVALCKFSIAVTLEAPLTLYSYFGSLVKVFLFIFNTIISLALIGGAGPRGSVKDGSTWTDLPVFKNGFGGFASAALLAIWAIGDQIYIGVLGGEAKSPRYSMAHAANVVPWRVSVFYMVSVVLVSILVPSSDSRLLGGSGSAASPFVISIDDAGIKGAPDLINACMIIGILAIALECIYLPSRILRTMALQKLIPPFIAKVDDKGRPRWALLITSVVGIILTYMSLSGKGLEVLNWLISITSASFFINWAIVAFTSFRFRAAVKAQNAPIFSGTYSWKSPLWPLAPAGALTISTLLLICLLYSSIEPLGDTGFTTYNFFMNILGILVIAVPTALYKIFLRTEGRDPAVADLVTGRRQLTPEEIILMDDHYSRPLWRRVGMYVKLW